jgi:GT2 family glycosyltransferase
LPGVKRGNCEWERGRNRTEEEMCLIDPLEPDYSHQPGLCRLGYAPTQEKRIDRFPATTIVTPFYNTDSTFHQTALSVQNQTFQDWEWVIVNDASTDLDSLAILDTYRNLDSRIRVIDHEVNRGPGAARNTGFRAARTPYALQLDSDDLIEPTALEKWLLFLDAHPAFGFVGSYHVGFGAQHYLWSRGFHEGYGFTLENLVNATALVRTDAWAEAGGYDETNRLGLEDWDFWLRCANAGVWGGTIPEYLHWYRRRPTHQDRWNNWSEEGCARFRKSARLKYPRLFEPAGFPNPVSIDTRSRGLGTRLSFRNTRVPSSPRSILVVTPRLDVEPWAEAARMLASDAHARGWSALCAVTARGPHPAATALQKLTEEIFYLSHLGYPKDIPSMLAYLVESRHIDRMVCLGPTCHVYAAATATMTPRPEWIAAIPEKSSGSPAWAPPLHTVRDPESLWYCTSASPADWIKAVPSALFFDRLAEAERIEAEM